MRRLIIMLSCLCLWTAINAQHRIMGFIRSAEGLPLAGVVLVLKDIHEQQLLAYSISDKKGIFVIRIPDSTGKEFMLDISHISYQPVKRLIITKDSETLIWQHITMIPRVSLMKELVVKGKLPAFKIMPDSIEFRATAYMTPQVSKLEDLLKNIQGFSVDENGQISFNGEEIEKILIEGEDLAGNTYQLISKNLNAALVDKLQVIQHFQEDRLLAGITEEGKPALNIKMDQRRLGRPAGSAEIAAGNSNKKIMDLNALYMRKEIKILGILNANNTGIYPNGNFQYYAEKASGQGALSNSSFTEDIIRAAQIQKPDLPDAYTRNNQDRGIAAMAAMSLSKYTKMRLTIADSRLKEENESAMKVSHRIPDQPAWSEYSLYHGSNRRISFSSQLESNHDAGKNNTGQLVLGWSQRNAINYFNSSSHGAIDDLLREELGSRKSLTNFSWRESFSLSKRRVMRFNLIYSLEKPVQHYDLESSRLAAYWGLPLQPIRSIQWLAVRYQNTHFNWQIIGRKGRLYYQWGIRTTLGKRRYLAWLQRFGQGSNDSLSGSLQSMAGVGNEFTSFGRLYILISPQSSWTVELAAGYGQMKDSTRGTNWTPVYRGKIEYVRRWQSFGYARLHAELKQELPLQQLFYPANIISSGPSVINGLNVLQTRQQMQAGITAGENNLLEAYQYVCNFNISLRPRDFAEAQELTPYYSWRKWQIQRGTVQIDLGAMAEKYYSFLKARIHIDGDFRLLRRSQRLNQADYLTSLRFITWKLQWKTAFGGLVNFDLQWQQQYFRSNILHAAAGTDFVTRSWQGSAKCRLKAAKSLYMALLGSMNRFDRRQVFFACDAFLQWVPERIAGNKYKFSLIAHNVAGRNKIVFSDINAYSESYYSYSLQQFYWLLRFNINF